MNFDEMLRNEYHIEEEDTMEGLYMIFTCDEVGYGFPVEHVTEIVALLDITEVPDMPEYVKGVINLRGRVLPVIDIRIRFGLKDVEYHDRTCVIILSTGNQTVGVIVDAVNEVIKIPHENIESAPRMSGEGQSGEFIEAMGKVGDSVKILLDIERLLAGINLELMEDHVEVGLG